MTIKPDYAVMLGFKACPQAELHYAPGEQMRGRFFSEWARGMSEAGWRPVKCPGCGLYRIWERA